jgi:hypothetical protein
VKRRPRPEGGVLGLRLGCSTGVVHRRDPHEDSRVTRAKSEAAWAAWNFERTRTRAGEQRPGPETEAVHVEGQGVGDDVALGDAQCRIIAPGSAPAAMTAPLARPVVPG